MTNTLDISISSPIDIVMVSIGLVETTTAVEIETLSESFSCTLNDIVDINTVIEFTVNMVTVIGEFIRQAIAPPSWLISIYVLIRGLLVEDIGYIGEGDLLTIQIETSLS